MKYILGIDTTFHASAIGLVSEDGKVLLNAKIDIDFTDENAERFFYLHMKNILSLIKPVMEKHGKDVFLISVANQKGPFHSMPVGVIVANTLSYFFGKEIMGVDHEVSHLYSNWLDRDQAGFNFPIISLSISGAHTNIWLMKNHSDISIVRKIIFQEDKDRFSGLGAFFDWVCLVLLGIKIKKGEGGAFLEKLASSGKPKYREQLKFEARNENGNFKFSNIRDYLVQKIKELEFEAVKGKEQEQFQKDFACSLSEAIFDELVQMMGEAVVNFGAKEVHLAGGAAVNKFVIDKLKNFCEEKKLVFRKPAKPDFCGDNGAMAAIGGYYGWKTPILEEKDKNKFLAIKPSDWYYKYYVNYFSK